MKYQADSRHVEPISDEKVAIPEFGEKLDAIEYADRPSVYAVVENNQRIAIIKTSNGYFLPGGGIDPGESDLEALKREIMEETGHQVLVAKEIGKAVEHIHAISEGKAYTIQSTFYKAQIGLKVGEGTEKDHELLWLQPGEAIPLLVRKSQAWAVQNRAEIVP